MQSIAAALTRAKSTNHVVHEARCIAELVALQIVGWSFTTLTLTALLFWAGIPIGPYHLWAALLLFLLIGGRLVADWRAWLIATAWLAAFTLAGGVALEWLYDFTGDGQLYHLPGILALAQGWNPFRTSRLVDWNPKFLEMMPWTDINYPIYVYVQHYAKGSWIVAAAFYRGTGLLEGAKVFTLLYALAVYLIAAPFLSRLGLSLLWSRMLAVAAAANPVVLYQMSSFFVDGELASLCTLLVLSSLDYFLHQRKQALVLVAACVALLVNVKFTGAVFAVALIGGLGVLAWFRAQHAEVVRYIAIGATSFLLAAMLIGYQPYVTNFVQQGHPFYPALRSDNGRDVLWHSAPPEFMAMNPVEKEVRSLFGRSAGADEMPQWKIPFTISKEELYIFFNAEPRYGGFGPFFGSILLVSLVLFVAARKATQREIWNMGSLLAALIAATALMNPAAWWARLSPQQWLVPVIMMSAIALGASGWPRRTAGIVALLLLGNSALVAALNLGRAVEKNLIFRTQIAELHAMSSRSPLEIAVHPSFQMVTEHRLTALSIPHRLVRKPSCMTPVLFSYPAAAQAAACPS